MRRVKFAFFSPYCAYKVVFFIFSRPFTRKMRKSRVLIDRKVMETSPDEEKKFNETLMAKKARPKSVRG